METEATATEVTSAAPTPARNDWAVWQRVLFRFFFVYLVLQVAPWNMFRAVPGVPTVLGWYFGLVDWAVRAGNAQFFHVRETLIPVNGSGDTSWAWAQLCLYLSIALVVCLLWSALDRNRRDYRRLSYWLRLAVRYYIASAALSYGIIKLFALQMPFPALSQLATPLGDLLPMRFSWLFIGYSLPYQIFSGAMETIAGLLLLNRRTVTAGLFAATGAFTNVVMINLSYDVPVKLYASHLLFACLFLLALDAKRLLNFLVLNKPTPPTDAYTPVYSELWQFWGSIAVKGFIIYQIAFVPLRNSHSRYMAIHATPKAGPFKVGVYDVRSYVVNKTPLPSTASDTIRWKDVIFDNTGSGSVNTRDPLFWQRYGRGYFTFQADTAAHTAKVWRTSFVPRERIDLFNLRYEVPDTNTIRLHMVIRGDSVHVELARVDRHFQLTERQFHWISEYNR